MVRHSAGTSIVVNAGLNGSYVGTFSNAGSPHVSNEIVAVDLDANEVKEILASSSAGAAGNDYESFFLDGCDLSPIGGASPSLIQRASVMFADSFECNFGAHGKVQLDTTKSVLNTGTSSYDETTETFNFDGTNWVSPVSNNSTTTNPTQLPGASTCG